MSVAGSPKSPDTIDAGATICVLSPTYCVGGVNVLGDCVNVGVPILSLELGTAFSSPPLTVDFSALVAARVRR